MTPLLSRLAELPFRPSLLSPPRGQFAYPESDPDAVTIRNADLQRLQPGEFLNDNIIDFSLKHRLVRACTQAGDPFRNSESLVSWPVTPVCTTHSPPPSCSTDLRAPLPLLLLPQLTLGDAKRVRSLHVFNCFFWKKLSGGRTSTQPCVPVSGEEGTNGVP